MVLLFITRVVGWLLFGIEVCGVRLLVICYVMWPLRLLQVLSGLGFWCFACCCLVGFGLFVVLWGVALLLAFVWCILGWWLVVFF